MSMYSPWQWRVLKAQRDELLEASKAAWLYLQSGQPDGPTLSEVEAALKYAIIKAEKPA